jgi:WD40 repeat protein
LAADRRQRYPSVAAFSRDLAAYQDGFPTEAEQAGTLRQIQLLIRRHRVAAAALAILLVLTAGFIARLVISERRAERNAEAANLARTSAETSAEAARKALAQAQISLAEVAYRELDSRTMIRALESVPPSYRDGDWNYLRRQADNSQAILSAGPGHFYIGAAAHPQEPGIFALISTEPALHLVDVRTGLRRGQIQLSPRHAGIQIFRSLGFSPDGKRLIVGGLTGGGGVAIYDIDTGSPTVEWDSPGTDLVQFGPDGSLALEINSPHQQLSLRDTTTGRLLWSRERCSMAVFATRDRMLIASGEQLMLLQAATGALLQTFPSAHAPVFRLVLSPDSTAVYYTTPNDMFVRGQRLDDGELIFERPLTDAAGRWASVALSRDGTQVLGAITDDDHKTIIRVWDRSTGTQIRTLRGHHCPLESLATHPRSEDIVATGTESRSWSLASHPPDWELPQSTWGGRFLGNDNLVFSAGGLVRLGEPGHWVPSATPLPEPFSGTLHAGSSAGLGVIGIRGSRSRGISGAEYLLARTTAEGTALTPGRLSGRDKVVIQIQPSPDGRHLAAADDYSGLTIHETTTGRLVSTSDLAATLRSVTAFAWLNPSRLVGIGSTLPRGSEANEERVILWDMPTGETLCHRSHPTAMDCLAPLPGGMEFAEAGVDKLIRIRDATSLAPLRTFRAHDGPVVAMAAHPTRALLATASTDLMIRLWRVPSGELLAEWPQAPSAPMNLVFSPSGDRLAATDHQGRVRIWNLGSGLR